MTRRNPNVFLAGAGAVAGALAGALRHAGVPVLGLWARRREPAHDAAKIAGVAAYSPEPPELLRQADAVILAITDDAIGEVATALADAGLVGGDQVLLQCAGGRPAAESFAAVRGRVAGVGTMHPLRAIADPAEAALTMRGTVFGVEGDDAGRALARDLVVLLGGTPLELTADTMPVYHAAAVLSSSCLVALIDAAVATLAAAGHPREAALATLLPLVEGAIGNLRRLGPVGGLTGPIARGDAATVERHLTALAAHRPEVLEIYRALSRRVLELARQRGTAPAEGLARIAAALAPEA